MRIHSVGLLSRVVGARIRGRRTRALVIGAFEALIASLLVLPLLVTGLVIGAPPASAAIPQAVVAPPLDDPVAVAVDGAGNLFIANYATSSIEVLPAATGTVFGVHVTADQLKTVVSTGLSGPSGLAFDSAGDLFITNVSATASIVVLAKTSGTMFGVTVTANQLSTVASGQLSASGIAIDSAGNLYWDSYSGGSISVLAATTGTVFGAQVTANKVTTLVGSGLTGAEQLNFDPQGNLYVAASGDNDVRVLAVSTETLFGTSVTANEVTPLSASLSPQPEGVAFDSAGNMYVSSFQNNNVLVIPQVGGTIFGQSDVAGTSSQVGGSGLNEPSGLAFDSSGNLYVADVRSNSVSGISAGSSPLYGVAITPDRWTTVVAGLNEPEAIAYDSSGNLFIANTLAGTLDVYPATTSTIFGVAVTADRLATLFQQGPGAGTFFGGIGAIAFDKSGNMWVGTADALYVVPLTSGTVFGQTVKANQLNQVYFDAYQAPNGTSEMAFDSAGDLFYSYQDTIGVLPVASGTIFGTTVTADAPITLVSSGLSDPLGMSFDSLGNLYVADEAKNTVSVLPVSTGKLYGQSVVANTLTPLISSGLTSPQDVVFDAANDLYVSDYGTGRILALTSTSKTLYGVSLTADDLGVVGTGINEPTQMVVSDGVLYFSNYGSSNVGNNTVSELVPLAPPIVSGLVPTTGPSTGGTAITISGTGFTGATAVKFGSASGSGFSVNANGTAITLNTPIDPGTAPNLVDVTVTTPGGTSVINSADEFSYTAAGATPPTVTKVAPGSGSTAGGSAVTITGTNLLSGTVNFGSVSAPGVTCATATSCTGITPSASSTGVIDVTVTTTGGTSTKSVADQFTYLFPTKLVAKAALVSALFNLSATLTETQTGAPIGPGQAVTFTAGGTTLGVGYTNASGVVSLNILSNLGGVLATIENDGYTVHFAGNATYLPSAATGALLAL